MKKIKIAHLKEQFIKAVNRKNVPKKKSGLN